MIVFKNIGIKNFLSYGNKLTTLKLDDEKSTLIIGNNKDIGATGGSANGVGKTAAIQAVIFAIYGKGLDKLKTDEFINLVNEKNLHVELDFSINGVDYKIIRQRKPNSVELYRGTENLTRDSMSNTDKAIVELFYNIPHHIFLGVVALTPHLEPFMSMSTGDQRNFIESMLSLDVLAKRAEKLKVIRKEQQVDLKIAEEKLGVVQANNDRVQKQIENLALSAISWDDQHNQKIDELIEKIKNFVTYDRVALEKELSEIEELSAEESELHQELLRSNSELSKFKDVHELSSTLKEIQGIFSAIGDTQRKYDALVSSLDEEEQHLKEKYGSLEDVRSRFDAQQRQVSKQNSYQQQKTVLASKKRELTSVLSSLEKQLDSLVKETDQLASGTCPYCKQSHVDEEKVEINVSTIEEIEKEITDVSSNLKQISDEYEDVCIVLDSMTNDTTNWSQVISAFGNLDYKRTLQKDTYDKTMADYEKRLSYLCGDDDQDKVVDSLIEDIEYLNSEREKMSKEINEKRAKHGALSSEIQQRKLGLKFKSVAELDLYMTQKEKMQTQLETLQKETNPNMDKISVLEETLVDESEIKNECEELVNLEKHTGYLIKLLTDPKSFIRKNILEQYIPAVNKKILENTQELGLGHVCKINSDLSVDVTYMNRPVSYYNLSQGERLRLNLAVSSAFRHLMGLLGKSCNIALVDEYLDSALDSEGMRKAFSFIKKQAKSVWIVSHKDELKGQTDRTMTVVKQNGFSSIEWA